jgi:hypothetical protein
MPPTSPPNKTTSNTPADIDAGLTQTFVFAITPTAPIAPTDVQLTFDCSNTDPAPIFAGAAVNTLLFSASTGPIPDIIGTGMGAIRYPDEPKYTSDRGAAVYCKRFAQIY